MRPTAHLLEARRRSGEARSGAPGVGALHDDADVEGEITGLDALATDALRIKWRKLYCAEPPTRLSRDLLIRGIAYKVQERAYGGLSPTAQRRLRSLVGEKIANGGSVLSPGLTLKPGTKLVREWHGRAYTVTVLVEGFDYDGERYRSLTHIANRITGSHRSGPVFFGLKNRSSRPPFVAEPRP